MQKTKIPSALLLWNLSFLFLALPWICQAESAKASPGRMEMTGSDLFSNRGWNSRQVTIQGFGLGMNWPEAQQHARLGHFSLVQLGVAARQAPECNGEGWCQVCETKLQCDGVSLQFGSTGQIIVMSIGNVPDFAPREVRLRAIQRRFKGATREFFDQYSKSLRLKLLGPESNRLSTAHNDSEYIEYTYRELGLILEIKGCPNQPPENSCSGLEVRFVPLSSLQ